MIEDWLSKLQYVFTMEYSGAAKNHAYKIKQTLTQRNVHEWLQNEEKML